MVAHVFDPSIHIKDKWISEFEARLVYKKEFQDSQGREILFRGWGGRGEAARGYVFQCHP